jgi:hypothetical protein
VLHVAPPSTLLLASWSKDSLHTTVKPFELDEAMIGSSTKVVITVGSGVGVLQVTPRSELVATWMMRAPAVSSSHVVASRPVDVTAIIERNAKSPPLPTCTGSAHVFPLSRLVTVAIPRSVSRVPTTVPSGA